MCERAVACSRKHITSVSTRDTMVTIYGLAILDNITRCKIVVLNLDVRVIIR